MFCKLFSEYSYALILRKLGVGGRESFWGSSHAVENGKIASTIGARIHTHTHTFETPCFKKSIFISALHSCVLLEILFEVKGQIKQLRKPLITVQPYNVLDEEETESQKSSGSQGSQVKISTPAGTIKGGAHLHSAVSRHLFFFFEYSARK